MASDAACLRPNSQTKLLMINAATRLTFVPVLRLQRVIALQAAE